MVEIDFDRLMDATQTVIQLKAGDVLTAEQVAEIHYAFDCERQHEDDAVDAYSKGYAHGVYAGAGADKAALMEKLETLETRLAVVKAMDRFWEKAATSTDTRPGTDGPQSGPVVNPKPIDTQPGETL